jgi:hypothetical protein
MLKGLWRAMSQVEPGDVVLWSFALVIAVAAAVTIVKMIEWSFQ